MIYIGDTVPALSADARAILESMGDAFYALDADWRFTYANQRALAFWGLTAADLLGQVIWDRLPRLRGTLNERELRRARAEQRTISFEAPSPVTKVWVQVSVCPFASGVAVYWRDISERKLAESTVRANEEHLRLAQEAAEIGTWEVDLVTRRIHWSPEMFHLIGRSPSDAPRGDFYALWLRALHPEDREEAARAARAFSMTVSPFRHEFRIVRPGGSIRWLQSRGNVLPDANGRPRRMLGINIDITDRKRTEGALERRVAQRTQALRDTVAELQHSRARYTAIFEHAPVDLVFMRVRSDGVIVCEDVNPAHTRHTGFSRDDLIGKTLEETFSPDQAGFAMAQYKRVIETGQVVEYEYTTNFPAGNVVRRSFLVPLHGPGGKIENILLTSIDLTAMRQMEEQLRHAQKMEAIGQLTGGVAHDFNNLLTAVIGNLELLERRLQDPQQLRYVQSAIRAAQRGGELTQQLLAYARRQNLSQQAVDVNAAMQGMADLLQRSLGGLVQVEMDLAPDLWRATADPTQLELMILNLAINARDAMPVGGLLRIVTRNLTADPALMPMELEMRDHVVISVIDNGTGMPREVQERAFEPFFTTKEVGKGSGLGLPQVYGLARQFGGTARLFSAAGRGTTVEVILPRAEENQLPTALEPISRPETPVVSGTILVVDDEPDVREVAVQFLNEAGYNVQEAASAAEAIAALTTAPIDLAIVDYAMPGMSGVEMVRQAREKYSDLKVIYISGNVDRLGAEAAETSEAVLTKPYSSATLLQTVAEVLKDR
ncbi:MAG: PAS domain S-box protein [Acetobacteraceae bacterium]|nr:PAS domain S-box protein [Acetobacteraceae bacterium]